MLFLLQEDGRCRRCALAACCAIGIPRPEDFLTLRVARNERHLFFFFSFFLLFFCSFALVDNVPNANCWRKNFWRKIKQTAIETDGARKEFKWTGLDGQWTANVDPTGRDDRLYIGEAKWSIEAIHTEKKGGQYWRLSRRGEPEKMGGGTKRNSISDFR